MKLDARTGQLSPDEIAKILQQTLEERFHCEAEVWPDVDVVTEYDPADWRSEFPPTTRAVFKGYRFKLIED